MHKTSHPRQRKVSLAERRYTAVMWVIRKNRQLFNKQDQVEISHISKEIQDYGYSWFPNHYLMDTITKLEDMITRTLPKGETTR